MYVWYIVSKLNSTIKLQYFKNMQNKITVSWQTFLPRTKIFYKQNNITC